MSRLVEDLNPEQAEAVTWPGGPLLILAGAGSGKTRVLIYRVLWLAEEGGVEPREVFAVTFTNKAAGEMRSRLAARIGPERARGAWFHTFHGACVRILRQEIEGRLPGYQRNFAIYDPDDQLKVAKQAMAAAGVSETFFTPRTVLSRIGDAKNRSLSPEAFAEEAGGFSEEAVAKVYPHYQRLLRQNNAVDFDDLLLLTLELFDRFPEVLASWQARFRHVLVDEYQDTNRAQYRLVKALSSAHRNIAVVGDDDQSIYAWRGADVRNILDFKNDYPDAKVVKLSRNYRSTRNVLAAAMAVIRKNQDRWGKELWTENPSGDPVSLAPAKDEREEGRWIAEEIGRLATLGFKRGEVAVFYRTNAQSRALEEAFRGRGVPYRLVGALRFFERAEIKDAVSYLKAIVNPDDTLALKRILNVPPRGIGETSVERLEAFAEGRKVRLADALAAAELVPDLKPGPRKKLTELASLLSRLREDAASAPPGAFLRRVVEETGYLDWLSAQEAAADQGGVNARVDNLAELIGSATELSRESPSATVAEFLDRVSLVSDVDDYDAATEAVTLMTFHSAKGLEFPVVFMSGMEEGIFPHSRVLEEAGGDGRSIEEERRLCYVGMTRAMKRLYLSWADERASWGARRPLGPSRFLAEIPPEVMAEVRAPFRPSRAFTQSYDEFDQRTHWEEAETAPGGIQRGRTAWQRGMRIVHVQFGPGQIREVEGGGDNAKLAVDFDRGGLRKLLVKYAGKDLRPE